MAVGFHRRFRRSWATARRLLAGSDPNGWQDASLTLAFDTTRWRAAASLATEAAALSSLLDDVVTHQADLLAFLLDRPIVRLRAAPGNEYADVVREIVDGFTGFKDIETGEPMVASALSMEALVGEAAPRRDVLPDVMVNWGERPLTASIGVRSPRYGELRWERGARFHSGRSGNHLPWGWLVAAGPDIEAGQAGSEFETVDLTPTIFDWLGVPIPDRFVGRAIDQRWSQPT